MSHLGELGPDYLPLPSISKWSKKYNTFYTSCRRGRGRHCKRCRMAPTHKISRNTRSTNTSAASLRDSHPHRRRRPSLSAGGSCDDYVNANIHLRAKRSLLPTFDGAETQVGHSDNSSEGKGDCYSTSNAHSSCLSGVAAVGGGSSNSGREGHASGGRRRQRRSATTATAPSTSRSRTFLMTTTTKTRRWRRRRRRQQRRRRQLRQ